MYKQSRLSDCVPTSIATPSPGIVSNKSEMQHEKTNNFQCQTTPLKENKFKVSQILGSRFNQRLKRTELLVNWKGFPATQSSWEPISSLYEDVPKMVKTYIEQNRYSQQRQAKDKESNSHGKSKLKNL